MGKSPCWGLEEIQSWVESPQLETIFATLFWFGVWGLDGLRGEEDKREIVQGTKTTLNSYKHILVFVPISIVINSSCLHLHAASQRADVGWDKIQEDLEAARLGLALNRS